MTRKLSPLAFAVALALATPAALAQDASLYEDVANPNSTFVRVVDAGTPVAVIQSASFDGVEGGVTPYVVIDGATEVQITSGETSATEAIQPAGSPAAYQPMALPA